MSIFLPHLTICGVLNLPKLPWPQTKSYPSCDRANENIPARTFVILYIWSSFSLMGTASPLCTESKPSYPELLLPITQTTPCLSRTTECSSPQATSLTCPLILSTITGFNSFKKVSCPSYPYSLLPHMKSLPTSSMKPVWAPPAFTDLKWGSQYIEKSTFYGSWKQG